MPPVPASQNSLKIKIVRAPYTVAGWLLAIGQALHQQASRRKYGLWRLTAHVLGAHGLGQERVRQAEMSTLKTEAKTRPQQAGHVGLANV